jgi:hypothetical protein
MNSETRTIVTVRENFQTRGSVVGEKDNTRAVKIAKSGSCPTITLPNPVSYDASFIVQSQR